MQKKMLIDATHAEETRVVVVDGTRVEEFDFESVNKRQLAGNIYLAKVTRVEPSLQAAFIDYGGNRHGFLAFSEIHPDYYQIPVADRQALLEEERAFAEAAEEEERKPDRRKPRGRGRGRGKAEAAADAGAEVATAEVADDADEAANGAASRPIAGMDVIEPEGDGQDDRDDDAQGAEAGGEDRSAEAEARGNERPYRAMDHASDTDAEIESIAEEDVAEEIRAPRKPRPRRYKIQEVVKVRQIMLVQVVKEERGNKGAALTTYLSLAGRYCVLMPNTARGGGISRKITNAADRKKLKEIAGEMEVPQGAGLIVRTAGSQRTKAEIKRDYEYLMRLWEQIRDLTLKSVAPAPIYEEGNLIKRTIRDLYSREIDEVWVEGEAGYRAAKDFMKMIMPSHAKNVKLYQESMPLFARYQVESYLSSMFNPTVQLKSGGYIVIGVTEALVAIDINSGRATKEGSIEETALKTNLEAAEEIARQLRLRDLAGLIVIDFIDMEERKNNAAVEKRLKDKLKTDRARIQVGRISGFGLMEMSRQRLRPGMLEATTQPCPHCHGTGLIRSDDNLALAILRQLEEEGTRKRSREVLLKAPVGIVNFLINQKREHIAGIEARYGMSVRVESDPMLISPDFSIEKFKTATRVVSQAAPVVSIDTTRMDELDEEDLADETADEAEESVAEAAAPQAHAGGEAGEDREGGRRKRRRRRRRRGGRDEGDARGDTRDEARDDARGETWSDSAEAGGETEAAVAAGEGGAGESGAGEGAEGEGEGAQRPGRRRSRGRRGRGRAEEAVSGAAAGAEDAAQADSEPAPVAASEAVPEAAEAKPKKTVSRSRRKTAASEAEAGAAEAPAEPVAEAAKPARKSRAKAAKPAAKPAAKAKAAPARPKAAKAKPAKPEPPAAEPTLEPAVKAQPAPEPAEAGAGSDAAAKPKRKGWWSLTR